MKKIAVASEGNMVTEHFGHCSNFWLFDTENGVIVGKESVANPGHKPGFLPNFLHDKGANVIISGGMGGGAMEIFEEHNIEIVVGASGDVEENVKAYLAGKLVSTNEVCSKHEHEGHCED